MSLPLFKAPQRHPITFETKMCYVPCWDLWDPAAYFPDLISSTVSFHQDLATLTFFLSLELDEPVSALAKCTCYVLA